MSETNATTQFTVRLPSRGLVYKDIEKNNANDQIQIRTFKGRDEKLIAEISSENFEKKFLTILKSVLTGINPEELTSGDRQALMVWETINSYDKEFTVNFECEHCWQKSDYRIDLSKLEMIELPEDFKEPYGVKLPNGDSLQLRLLRVKDLIAVDQMDKQGQNVWLYRYALSIVNDKSIWENVEYLEDLSTKDLMVIRAFHDKFNHGIKMEEKYTCPKCGGTGIMPVPFRLDMLLPFGKELAGHLGDAV